MEITISYGLDLITMVRTCLIKFSKLSNPDADYSENDRRLEANDFMCLIRKMVIEGHQMTISKGLMFTLALHLTHLIHIQGIIFPYYKLGTGF